MITAEDVKKAWTDCNGSEAANEVCPAIYRAAAHYANLNEMTTVSLEAFPYITGDIATVIDVLRLGHSGEFGEQGISILAEHEGGCEVGKS